MLSYKTLNYKTSRRSYQYAGWNTMVGKVGKLRYQGRVFLETSMRMKVILLICDKEFATAITTFPALLHDPQVPL